MFTHCLSDVALIPPCDRVVLEMEFAELCKWAVSKLRSCLLEMEQLLCTGQQAELDASSQQQFHKVCHHSFHHITVYSPLSAQFVVWCAAVCMQVNFNWTFFEELRLFHVGTPCR